jgi:hypothetical protein
VAWWKSDRKTETSNFGMRGIWKCFLASKPKHVVWTSSLSHLGRNRPYESYGDRFDRFADSKGPDGRDQI